MGSNSKIKSIYQDIRSRILTDEYCSGQKLSEIQLAKEHNCSRTPIREILQRLENDGLIIIKPKSGTYVKHETSKDFVELMQVRASLERLAFSLAVSQPLDTDINALRSLEKEMDILVDADPIDMMSFAQTHYRFHLTLMQASRNGLLIQLFERLNLRSSHMFYTMMDNNLGRITQKEHKKIVSYFKNRDPEGAVFIQAHLEKKIQRFMEKKALSTTR